MPKTWIKICGTTNLEDALASVEAGADALGFIFAESPRRVRVEDVRKIIDQLPPSIAKVGVFVDATTEEIALAVKNAGLTHIQLHQPATEGRMRSLRSANPLFGSQIIQVVKVTKPSLWEVAKTVVSEAISREPRWGNDERETPDFYLFDTGGQAAPGGTGVSFDWADAMPEIQRYVRNHHKVIVAGGLTSDNVDQAIAILSPFGVDVVSGVEREKGKKDHAKLRAFVQAVREADAKRGPAR